MKKEKASCENQKIELKKMHNKVKKLGTLLVFQHKNMKYKIIYSEIIGKKTKKITQIFRKKTLNLNH